MNETNEFVFAGNSGTAHGVTNTDLPILAGITLIDRWQRDYYIERRQGGTQNAGTTDIRIGFNFAGTGITLETDKGYYLLYRAGTSGTFTAVVGGTGVASDGKVWFNITNANFTTGYYTIAKSDQELKTWYSLNSGNWDDFNTWSLKPTEPDNPFGEIPGLLDRAVITNNKIVTVTQNGTTCGTLDVIDGTIDFGTTTGHYFSAINGQPAGRIKLAADNFPSGDATGFTNGATGGTVEYYGGTYNLATQRVFNNMVVNLTTGNTISLLANYNLNGNLNIERGNFRIGNNSSTAIISIDIAKNVEVYSGAQISVGSGNTIGTYSIPGVMPPLGQYHSIFHQVRIGGGMVNNGTINFTNLTAPNYGQFASNGAATVTFYGATNALVELNNTTNFYNLIVDKGIDRTYVLTIDAQNANHFRLYGPNNVGRRTGGIFTGANPEIRKALWIRTGTLKLMGNIEIPSLSEGFGAGDAGGNGDYAVPANASLWIADAGVRVYSTARTASPDLYSGTLGVIDGTSHQAMSVYGEFRITSGFFSTRNSAGFIFWSDASATIRIEGGICDVAQFRSAHGGAGGNTSIVMTNGEMYVRGNRTVGTINPEGGGETTAAYPIFGIIDPNGVFSMSGGTVHINAVTGNNVYGSNGICITTTPANHNVTGGTFNINVNGNDNVDVLSTSNLHNVMVSRLNAANTVRVYLNTDLSLSGSLTLNANTEFIARREWGGFNGVGRNLSVAGNLISNAGSIYRSRGNTTTFTGNGTALLNGDITELFHNLSVTGGIRTLTATLNTIRVQNNLSVSTGSTLNIQTGKELVVRGNITNSGTIGGDGKIRISERGRVTQINVTNGGSFTAVPTITLAAPPVGGTQATAIPVFDGIPAAGNALPLVGIIVTNTGSGYIAAPAVTITPASGATAASVLLQVHEIGGDGNGRFSNLEVNEPHPAALATQVTYLLANQTVTGTMTLANGIFDLKTFNLDVEGTLHDNTVAFYSNNRMFRTDGNHGDGGLTRTITANGTYLFPIGTKNFDNSVFRYAWANPIFLNVTSTGKVQINGVPRKLATLSDDVAVNDRKYLLYYWRVKHSNFATQPNVRNNFLAYKDDLFGQNNWANIVPGKVVGNIRTATGDLVVGNANSPTGILDFIPINTIENGEFTAGRSQVFQGSIQIYYSRLTTNDWYALTSNWNNGNNWSFTPHNGSFPENRPAAGDFPKIGDIAVIGYGGHASNGGYHSMNILANETVECADIQFIPNPTPGAYQSRLVLRVTAPAARANLSAGIIHGPGTFMMRAQPGLFPNVNADFSVFIDEELAVFNYFMETDGHYNIPTGITTEYPNLRIEGGGAALGNRRATFQENFWVKRNFTIDQGAEFITHNTAVGDFKVDNFLYLGGGTTPGRLSFNTTGNARTAEIQNLQIRNNATNEIRSLNTTLSSLEHRLIVKGSIIQTNGQLNLFNSGATSNNVILELTGTSNEQYNYIAGTNPSLYKLVVNKGLNQTATYTFNNVFTLNGPTNGTSLEKALLLQNGTLILNNSGININLSTGGEDFVIPSTAALRIDAGTANVTGANTGIFLDGLLRVNGGSMLLDGGAGVNNYILYSSSGNAHIWVESGTLTVGSQVRSNTLNELGTLRYTQTNGTVLIGKNAAPTLTRPIFEVRNPNSRFIYTGGSFTIGRSRSSANMADLYLAPSTATVLGTISIGDDNTPVGQTIDIQSEIALRNLTVGTVARATTARLKVNGLTLNGNLNINTGSTFNGNNLNLWMLGNITNNGTANIGTDTLFYVGLAQTQTGNVLAKHVVVNPQTSVTLQPSSALEVDGDLYINSGQLIDGGNTITLRGNVNNSASHASSNPAAGGMRFAGTALQRVFGLGLFGRIEVDNASGVQLENSISLDNNLTLTNGILQLQSNKLTLGLNANIIGTGLSNTKMIAVGGGDFLQGIQKTFPTVASAIPSNPYLDTDPAYTYSFVFPIGVDNGTVKKYTPVNFRVASSATQATINLYPVNRKHITFDDTQTDVLQYYWILNSSNTSNFTTLIRSHYLQTDVVGNEAAYIGARLYDDSWAKYEEGPGIVVVDEGNNWINFVYQGADNVSGEYTAGIQPHIPDVVPLFISTRNGDWEDAGTWVRDDGGIVPAGGPVGQRVRITTGHTVTVTQNFRRAYKTTINGRLDLGTTLNHILGQIQVVGYVEGTGTLALQRDALPAGDFRAFCNCGGGTLEFGGSIGGGVPKPNPEATAQYNNLTFVGNATWTMPSTNTSICGNLRVENSSTLKMPGLTSGSVLRRTTIQGNAQVLNTAFWDTDQRVHILINRNLEKAAGATLNTAYTSQLFETIGNQPQNFIGTFTLANKFRDLTFNHSSTLSLNGPVEVQVFTKLSNGRVLNASNLINATRNTDGLKSHGAAIVEGALQAKFINISPVKYLPVGKNNRQKRIIFPSLLATQTQIQGEYFDASPTIAGMPHTSRLAPLETISQTEYWRINGTNGNAMPIQFTLTGTSDVAAGVGNLNDLRIVVWSATNNRWEIAGGGSTVTGTAANGTIATTGNITFSGSNQFFTIGSVVPVVVPTAQIGSSNATICNGESYNLTISLTGNSPWQIQYSDGSTTTNWITVNTSPHVIPVSPTATTTYTLTAVRTQAGPVNGVVYGSPVTVTVHPLPTVFNVGGGGTICGSATTNITLSGSENGFTYELYRDGLILGNQQSGTGSPIQFTGIDVAGEYTIRAYNNMHPSCTLWMAGLANVNVGTSSFAQITAVLSDNPACEGLPVQFQITFNGHPPFTFSMADSQGNVWSDIVVTAPQLSGTGPYTYNFTLPNGYPAWIAPVLPNVVTYNITSISDGTGCGLGTIGPSINLNVYKLPETGPQYHIPNSFGE